MKKIPLLFWGIYVILLGVAVFFFVKYGIIADQERIASLVVVTREMEVPPIEVHDGTGRGSVALNDTLVVDAATWAIEYPKDYKWKTNNTSIKLSWKNGITIDHDAPPTFYRIGDLEVPYTLWKKANNDTIYVRKDSLNFKFFLLNRK